MHLGFGALARPLMYSTVACKDKVEFDTNQNQKRRICEPTASHGRPQQLIKGLCYGMIWLGRYQQSLENHATQHIVITT